MNPAPIFRCEYFGDANQCESKASIFYRQTGPNGPYYRSRCFKHPLHDRPIISMLRFHVERLEISYEEFLVGQVQES